MGLVEGSYFQVLPTVTSARNSLNKQRCCYYCCIKELGLQCVCENSTRRSSGTLYLFLFRALWWWLQFGEGAPLCCSLGDALPKAGCWQCCAPVCQPVQRLVAFPQMKHGLCGLKFLVLKLFMSRNRAESLKGNCWV